MFLIGILGQNYSYFPRRGGGALLKQRQAVSVFATPIDIM